MDESVENPQVKSVEVKCGHCGHRIPPSISFGGQQQFDKSTLIGNLMICPACGKCTVCDMHNLFVTYTEGKEEVGGFVGSGTGEEMAFDHHKHDKDILDWDELIDLPVSATPNEAHMTPEKKRKKSTRQRDKELGYYYQVSSTYCKACREIKEIRRRLPNRRVHFWVTLLTLGVWLIPWGLFELGARLHYWRCITCRRRIYHSIFS